MNDCIVIIPTYNEIENIESINYVLNGGDYDGGEIEIKYLRNSKTDHCKITPAKDVNSSKYKLGIWVRNGASGIGTLTYIKQKNSRFGAALGTVLKALGVHDGFEIEQR